MIVATDRKAKLQSNCKWKKSVGNTVIGYGHLRNIDSPQKSNAPSQLHLDVVPLRSLVNGYASILLMEEMTGNKENEKRNQKKDSDCRRDGEALCAYSSATSPLSTKLHVQLIGPPF